MLRGLLEEMVGALDELHGRWQKNQSGAQAERERTAAALLIAAEEGIRVAHERVRQEEDGCFLLLQTLPVLHAARVVVASLEVALARQEETLSIAGTR